MKKTLRLQIPPTLVNEPIIYKIVTLYKLIPNIVEANLDTDHLGEVIVELEGAPVDVERALLYLKELDIYVETIKSE